jgi:hypothetical protein
MKQLVVVFLALLFYALPLHPQKLAGPSPTQTDPDTASTELVTLTNAWNSAINAKDHAALEALMAPEFAL